MTVCLGLLAGSAPAQEFVTEKVFDVLLDEEDAPPDFGFGTGSLIVAPIPFSNPTIDDGLGLVGAWLFKTDAESDASILGIGGFRTNNGSTGYGLNANLNLNQNRYRLRFFAGKADLFYDFTALPRDITLEQSSELFLADLKYGFTRQLAFGVGVRYTDTELRPRFELGGRLPFDIERARKLKILKYGILLEWDNRDDKFYPTSGMKFELDAFTSDVEAELGDYDYRKATASATKLGQGFRDGDVWGITGTLCGATDRAPFFDACGIGLTDGMRGFSTTEHFDNRLVSAQAEYRGRFGGSRFGYVAFAGMGAVGEDFGDVFSSDLRAAGGVGLRYRVARDFPVDFSVDLTMNNQDEAFYYVYLGQSF